MSTETWEKQIAKLLVGKKIVETRYLTKEEAEQSGWYNMPLMIVLDDGTQLVPMSDDEGNDGGAIATSDKGLPTIPVMR